MNDVIYAFYDCLTDHVRMESGASSVSKGFDNWADAQKPANVDTKNITLNQWLNMWGRLCRGAAGISGITYRNRQHPINDTVKHCNLAGPCFGLTRRTFYNYIR